MSQWPSRKAKRVLAGLLKLGWEVKRQTGSHRTLARIAKHTGLTTEDL